MWARVVEVTFGCWLAMSPFIFAHPVDNTFWWANDFACALLIVVFALASYRSAWQYAHLLSLGVAFWLVGLAYWSALRTELPGPAAAQNWVCLALLLMMFAIIPNQASAPPLAWQIFEREYLPSAENTGTAGNVASQVEETNRVR